MLQIMVENENSDFRVLDNKAIGRNISLFRKLREMKAIEVAYYLDMKEATYTKYERGETKITIDLIQKLSDYFQVNPFLIIVSKPEQLLDKLQKKIIDIRSNGRQHKNRGLSSNIDSTIGIYRKF